MKLLLVLASLVSLASPDNQLVATFSQTTEKPFVTTYTLSYQGDTVLAPSRLGLNLDNRCWEMALGMRTLPQYASWMDPMEWDSVSTVETHEGYNTMTIYLSRKPEQPAEPSAPMGNARMADKDGLVRSNYRLNIEVRIYNEGLAFRYFFPEHPAAIFHKVTADETTYALPHGTYVYAEQWAQAGFEHIPIEQISPPVEMPLLCHRNNLWTAILTADVDDWCLSKLSPSSFHLSTVMYSPVDLVTY